MGGFAFDIPTSGETCTSSTSSSTRQDVLNLQGFLYIMKKFPDIIPDISEESTTGRVEYSPLRKALLIVQVGWFCASSLSRFIQHLPLSLLEVSTAFHGFCTLLTYFVWWFKTPEHRRGYGTTGQRGPCATHVLRGRVLQGVVRGAEDGSWRLFDKWGQPRAVGLVWQQMQCDISLRLRRHLDRRPLSFLLSSLRLLGPLGATCLNQICTK